MNETEDGNAAGEALVSNLVNGDVPAGQCCFASHRCTLKHYACNGHGCPVADGRRVAHPFSCAHARAYAECLVANYSLSGGTGCTTT